MLINNLGISPSEQNLQVFLDNIQQSHAHPEYDPFKSPPDVNFAKRHAQSRLVGQDILESADYCPCCCNKINKLPLTQCCDNYDFSLLGSAYPMYFSLVKQFAYIILLVFILTGSIIFLVINITCEESCVRFLGITVLNLDDIDKQVSNASYMNIFAVIMISILILFLKTHYQKEFYDLENIQEVISPSKFTLMVQNIPQDANKEEIEIFFKTQFSEHKIKKIIMCFDIEKYTEAFQEKNDLICSSNKLKFELRDKQDKLDPAGKIEFERKIKEIDNRIQKLTDNLEDFHKISKDRKRKSENFIGTCFIIFENRSALQNILPAIGVTHWRNFNPYITYNQSNSVIIQKAPNPSDVVWENLKFSHSKMLSNNSLMIVLSILILIFSFKMQLQIAYWVYPQKKESKDHMDDFYLQIRSILMTLLVTIVNAVLRQIVLQLNYKKRFESISQFQSSYINQYVFFNFTNSAFMPYLIHQKFDTESERRQLLIQDIIFILFANAFITPITKIVNYGRINKWVYQKIILRYKKSEIPYTQHFINSKFENITLDIAESYAYIARTLFLSSWYASVAPLGVLCSLIGLFLIYRIDKYYLVKLYSIPDYVSADVIQGVINVLELIPFIYICGNIEYEKRIAQSENIFEFMIEFIGYGITNMTLIFVSLALIVFQYQFNRKRKRMEIENYEEKQEFENMDYNDARKFFRTEYENCNPVTQYESNIDWINFLLDQNIISEDKSKQLIQLNRSNSINALNRVSRMTTICQIKQKSLRSSEILSINESKKDLFQDFSSSKINFQKE